MATTYTKGRIYKLDPNVLQPDTGQARTHMDPNGLKELAASLTQYGVLEPVIFRQDAESKLVIVAGERRVAAAKIAGLAVIPATYNNENYREISLIENLLREDLTPIDEAEGVDRLMKECGYSQNQLSEKISKSQSAISLIMSLNRLPENVKNQCRTNPNIPRYVLTEIAKIKTEEGMEKAFEKYMQTQSAKEQGPQPAKPRLRKEQVLVQQVDQLNGKLVNTAWQEWQEADRQDMVSVLQGIRGTAASILQDMGANIDREEEPETSGGRNLA